MKFKGFWSKEAFSTPGGKDYEEEAGIGFFTGENGYEPEEIEAIGNLAVGETWEATHYGPYHTVTRIE